MGLNSSVLNIYLNIDFLNVAYFTLYLIIMTQTTEI